MQKVAPRPEITIQLNQITVQVTCLLVCVLQIQRGWRAGGLRTSSGQGQAWVPGGEAVGGSIPTYTLILDSQAQGGAQIGITCLARDSE